MLNIEGVCVKNTICSESSMISRQFATQEQILCEENAHFV
jgi:cytidine deaminase